MLKVNPIALAKISSLFEMAKGNETLCHVFEKLDGATSAEAYHQLKNLSDQELRVIAAMIGQANKKFERTPLKKEA